MPFPAPPQLGSETLNTYIFIPLLIKIFIFGGLLIIKLTVYACVLVKISVYTCASFND